MFQKSDAKIQITITTAHLIRINYPLSCFNYCLSGTKVANLNKIRHIVSEQQLFKKWNSKTIFQYGKYRLGYLLQKVLRMNNVGYIFVTRLFGVKAMVFTKEDGILINVLRQSK